MPNPGPIPNEPMLSSQLVPRLLPGRDRRTRVTTPSTTMAVPTSTSSLPIRSAWGRGRPGGAWPAAGAKGTAAEGPSTAPAQEAGAGRARRPGGGGEGGQGDGGEGPEPRAGQEGEAGPAAALREEDEDGGGDRDAAQRRRHAERY